jgi:hypothetical protein
MGHPKKSLVVEVATEISGRSRSTVYSVMAGRFRSEPVDCAVKMARDLIYDHKLAIKHAKTAFDRQFSLSIPNATQVTKRM